MEAAANCVDEPKSDSVAACTYPDNIHTKPLSNSAKRAHFVDGHRRRAFRGSQRQRDRNWRRQRRNGSDGNGRAAALGERREQQQQQQQQQRLRRESASSICGGLRIQTDGKGGQSACSVEHFIPKPEEVERESFAIVVLRGQKSTINFECERRVSGRARAPQLLACWVLTPFPLWQKVLLRGFSRGRGALPVVHIDFHSYLVGTWMHAIVSSVACASFLPALILPVFKKHASKKRKTHTHAAFSPVGGGSPAPDMQFTRPGGGGVRPRQTLDAVLCR